MSDLKIVTLTEEQMYLLHKDGTTTIDIDGIQIMIESPMPEDVVDTGVVESDADSTTDVSEIVGQIGAKAL